MRKLLETISVLVLAILLWIAYAALLGPRHLTGPIPTHFNLAGQPDAWGAPRMLLVLPGIAMILYLLLTLASRFPASFNYPVRVSTQNRARLQQLALDMIVWLKAEIVSLFTLIEYYSIATARMATNQLPPSLMLVAMAIIFTTIGWYVVAMRRAA